MKRLTKKQLAKGSFVDQCTRAIGEMKRTKRAPVKKRRPAKTWRGWAVLGGSCHEPHMYSNDNTAKMCTVAYGATLYRATVLLGTVERKGKAK